MSNKSHNQRRSGGRGRRSRFDRRDARNRLIALLLAVLLAVSVVSVSIALIFGDGNAPSDAAPSDAAPLRDDASHVGLDTAAFAVDEHQLS